MATATRTLGAAHFHGARMVGAALLSNAASIGFTLGIYGVFSGEVAATIGASQTQVGLGHSAWALTLGLGSPLLGWLLLRGWLRPVLIGGVASIAAGLILLSRATSPVQAGAVLLILLGVGSLCTGTLPASTLVSNWYVRRRGQMLGLASTGTTLGSALLPTLAALLIGAWGWRTALVVLGVAAAALVIPVLWAWVIDRPEDVGQAPDGDPPLAVPVHPVPVDVRGLLRNPQFWAVASFFGLMFMPGTMMLIFSVPYAQAEIGMTTVAAASVLSVRAFSGACGKVVLGRLSDHVDKRWMLVGILAAYTLLMVAMLRATTPAGFAAASITMGFFGAALLPLQGAVVGAIFGREAFGPVVGLANGMKLPFNMAAAPLFGWMLDASGMDYRFAFRGYLIVFAVACVPLIFLRVPRAERGHAQA